MIWKLEIIISDGLLCDFIIYQQYGPIQSGTEHKKTTALIWLTMPKFVINLSLINICKCLFSQISVACLSQVHRAI